VFFSEHSVVLAGPVIFAVLFLDIVFCLQLKNGASRHLAWHADSTPRILLQDCQKVRIVAEMFQLLEDAAVFHWGLFKRSLNFGGKSHVYMV